MLAFTRHHVPETDGEEFLSQARRALEVLGQRPGFLAGRVGRAVEDPELWVLSSEWHSIGDYRRALSAYEVKVEVVPVLARALDEPTAFEVLAGSGGVAPAPRSARAADAGSVRVGEAAAPSVRPDLA